MSGLSVASIRRERATPLPAYLSKQSFRTACQRRFVANCRVMWEQYPQRPCVVYMGRLMAGQLASTTQKTALRAEFLARRDAQNADECRQRSAKICQRLGEVEPIQAAHRVAGYAAMRNEADLSAYLRARLASDIWLYFPRVADDNTLDFVRVKRLDTLVPGAFDILEPVGPPTPKSEIDVFLIPGV